MISLQRLFPPRTIIVVRQSQLYQQQQQRTFLALAGEVFPLSNLKEVEKFTSSNPTAVLYYTARWCPPCQKIKPLYKEMAPETSVALGMIDVDENPDAAEQAQITSVPTFVAYTNNQIVSRFAGADVKQLKEMVKSLEESTPSS